MVSVPEGLTLGASGLVSRQMKRGDRGSVPASRTFAEMFECEASGRDSSDCDATACAVWHISRYATGILIVLILFRGGMVWWYYMWYLIL